MSMILSPTFINTFMETHIETHQKSCSQTHSSCPDPPSPICVDRCFGIWSIPNQVQMDKCNKPTNNKFKARLRSTYQKKRQEEKNSFTNNSLICTMKRQRVQHRRMIHSISQTAPKSLKSINWSQLWRRWVDKGWNCVFGRNPKKRPGFSWRKKWNAGPCQRFFWAAC